MSGGGQAPSRLLNEGRSVIVYTAAGPDDPAIGRLRDALRQGGRKPADSGKLIGTLLAVRAVAR